MGRKLPFLPTCGSPSKTLSFRAVMTASDITGDLDDKGMTQESESSIESVIQGLSSDRFFFNPGKTSSILEEAKEKETEKDVTPFKENVSMMEMESSDPYVDFKKSMQEMVEADEGLKQWDNLQELLSMYLSLNDKINHGYIIRAFVDILLVNLGPSFSSTSTSSSCSSSINGQEQSILLNVSSSSNTNSNNNKKKMMISTSHESPEFTVSFTSSSASTSETCSSTSHSLEDDDDNDDVNHEDDEDLSSPQKVAVSDDVS